MKSYLGLLIIFAALFSSQCGKVVYEHRITPVDQTAGWGPRQIYVMYENGWFKRKLSSSSRHEYLPDVRHDGKMIVFLVEGNHLYVMNTDGSGVTAVPNAPTSAGTPRWSRGPGPGPGGHFILFNSPTSTTTSAIYRIALDGSGLAKVTNPQTPTRWDHLADSIDDKYIVFTRYDSNTSQHDLYVKYIWDNRPEAQLTDTLDRSEELPVVSHNGKMLAYRVSIPSAIKDQVHVARFNNPTNVTGLYNYDLQLPASINISGLDFSRDDKELFVSVMAADVSSNVTNRRQEIFRLRLDGSNQRRITNNSDEDTYPSVLP
jgi:Tol biopolymer transport system component